MHKYQPFNKNYKAGVPNQVHGPVSTPRPVRDQAAGQDASRGEREASSAAPHLSPSIALPESFSDPVGGKLVFSETRPRRKKVGDLCPKAMVLTA